MARSEAPKQPVYENRCYRCDVSTPPDAKRCIHCGGKIGKPLFQFESMPVDPELEMPQGPIEEIEEEEASPRRQMLRGAFALIWIAIALISTFAQRCAE